MDINDIDWDRFIESLPEANRKLFEELLTLQKTHAIVESLNKTKEKTMHFTDEQIEKARTELSAKMMLSVAGLFGPELIGVEVDDDECVKYLTNEANNIAFNYKDYL